MGNAIMAESIEESERCNRKAKEREDEFAGFQLQRSTKRKGPPTSEGLRWKSRAASGLTEMSGSIGTENQWEIIAQHLDLTRL
jgi:hypothetical protein